MSYSTKNRICAVVPFFNEAETIAQLLNKLLNFVDLVIAVNDGSTDIEIKNLPKSEKIYYISHKTNLGKGAALKSGFEKSIEINSEFTITLDADLQHQPELIPNFIEKVSSLDVVIGNRLHTLKNMPLQRRASNFLTSFMLSKKTGYKILDSQSGYRCFKTSILKNILPTRKGFEAESEMIVKASKENLDIGFIDIATIYGNTNSKMKPIEAIKGFLKVIISK